MREGAGGSQITEKGEGEKGERGLRMRILVVGAGGIGGYFGGRLLEAGRDVTFLVRPRRRAQLAASGLSIRSPKGDVDLPAPRTLTAEEVRDSFDLIFLSCKSYDLGDAIDSFAPAVGPSTAILPLLNGFGHLDFARPSLRRRAPAPWGSASSRARSTPRAGFST
jgi:ketopantoate reductase